MIEVQTEFHGRGRLIFVYKRTAIPPSAAVVTNFISIVDSTKSIRCSKIQISCPDDLADYFLVKVASYNMTRELDFSIEIF